MAVTIVTDSASALPQGLVDEYDIAVVPMRLTAAGVDMHDGDQPLEQLLRADRVTTSGPTPGEFSAAINARLEGKRETDGVLVLTIAATMSSTHEAAALAAQSTGGQARVLDTTTAAGAEGLVVVAAARAAQAGASLDEVERVARDVIGRVRLVATVPSLDRLVRSGRVPPVAGWAGRQLGINPLFEFAAGNVRRLRPGFSHEAALDRIIRIWRRSGGGSDRLHVVALHALAPDEAQLLLKRVSGECAPETAFVSEFSPVMVVHTGAGLVGLAWWWEPDEDQAAAAVSTSAHSTASTIG